ncbi:MAG: peptidoglycan-associated lipoprotein Pal [Pseudomonadota bacterium]
MHKFRQVAMTFAALGALVLATGCASTGSNGGGFADGSDGADSSALAGNGGSTYGTSSGEGISGGAVDGSGTGGRGPAPPRETVIYFDYDRSDVRAEYAELLARHARYIVDNGVVSVRLEGHTDERGSREYNIGLGERRAQAVRQALLSLRVPSTRLATVSFGEERPAVFGQDDASFAANRRVEIVYGR